MSSEDEVVFFVQSVSRINPSLLNEIPSKTISIKDNFKRVDLFLLEMFKISENNNGVFQFNHENLMYVSNLDALLIVNFNLLKGLLESLNKLNSVFKKSGRKSKFLINLIKNYSALFDFLISFLKKEQEFFDSKRVDVCSSDSLKILSKFSKKMRDLLSVILRDLNLLDSVVSEKFKEIRLEVEGRIVEMIKVPMVNLYWQKDFSLFPNLDFQSAYELALRNKLSIPSLDDLKKFNHFKEEIPNYGLLKQFGFENIEKVFFWLFDEIIDNSTGVGIKKSLVYSCKDGKIYSATKDRKLFAVLVKRN